MKLRAIGQIVAAGLCSCLICAGCNTGTVEERSYRAPDGRHELVLRGVFTRAARVWVRNNVEGVLVAEGQRRVVGRLYEAGYLDEAFDRQFPSHRWDSSKLLHFYRGNGTSPCDILSMSNETDNDVAFMAVRADDLIIAFDLKRHTVQIIPIIPAYDPAAVYVKVLTLRATGGAPIQEAVTVQRQPEPFRTGLRVRLTTQGIQIGTYLPGQNDPVMTGSACGTRKVD
jgi:hypothetical protein